VSGAVEKPLLKLGFKQTAQTKTDRLQKAIGWGCEWDWDWYFPVEIKRRN
jgi:hypothetical protein